jgi:hypothetical protein
MSTAAAESAAVIETPFQAIQQSGALFHTLKIVGDKKIPRGRSGNPRRGGHFSADDRAEGMTAQEAMAACKERGHDGIGFALPPDSDICILDMDDVRDPETGELVPEAATMVAMSGSACMVSYSGTGVHIFVRLPPDSPLRALNRKHFTLAGHDGSQLFTKEQFIVWTGNRLPGTPNRINLIPRQLEEAICARVKQATESARNAGAVHDVAPAPRMAPKYDAGQWGTRYGLAALTSAVDRIATAPEGRRNNTLNTEALCMARLSAGGELDEDHARDMLEAAANSCGLDAAEIRATIRSGFTAGLAQPRSALRDAVVSTNPDAELIEPVPVSLHDLFDAEPEPVAYVGEGLFPKGVVTLIGGHGGSGKTAVAFTLAAHLSAGRAWASRAMEQSRVLFLSCEDGAGVVRHKLWSVLKEYGIGRDEIGDRLRILDATDADPVMFTETRTGSGTTPLFDWLAGQCGEFGADVLIIDNASDTFAGNEVNRAQVRAFLRSLRRLRSGITVLLLAHVDKATARGAGGLQAYSGSTAWNNSVRSRLYLGPQLGRRADARTTEEQLRPPRRPYPVDMAQRRAGALVRWRAQQCR